MPLPSAAAPALLLCAAAVAGEALFEKNAPFVGGTGGYHTYRLPVLVVTPKGTILAFADGRRRHAGDLGKIDPVLRRSTTGGRSWLPMQVLATAPGKHTKMGNGTAVVDRTTGTARRGRVCAVCAFLRPIFSSGSVTLGDRKPRGEADDRRSRIGRTSQTGPALLWAAAPGCAFRMPHPHHGLRSRERGTIRRKPTAEGEFATQAIRANTPFSCYGLRITNHVSFDSSSQVTSSKPTSMTLWPRMTWRRRLDLLTERTRQVSPKGMTWT